LLLALVMFIQLLGFIIKLRAEKFRLARWGDMATRAATLFTEQINRVKPTIPKDIAERESVALLFEEIQFFVWRYRGAAPRGTPVAEFADALTKLWGSGKSSAISDDAVSDAETVIGSIEKLLGWLPKPLRQLLEAILEALKLVHGTA
jgi:hypothetical protein